MQGYLSVSTILQKNTKKRHFFTILHDIQCFEDSYGKERAITRMHSCINWQANRQG